MPDIDLRALLEEVPYEALHSYFETNNIPLPKDGAKCRLIDLLLTPEYKKDVRAAMLVELKAASRMFTSELKDSTEKLDALSREVEKKDIVTEHWKHVFQVASVLMGFLFTTLGFVGWNTVSDLRKTAESSQAALKATQVDLENAQKQLKEGDKIIEGYRGFVLNEVTKSVASVMDKVSTTWFGESDTAIADELEVYIDNLNKLNDVERISRSIDDGNISKKEVALIIEFLKLLEPIARLQFEVKDTNSEMFYQAEQKWIDLYAKWEKALNNNSVSDVTGKTYLAYISNIQGVFSHVRYSAAFQNKHPQDAMSHLELAQKAFDVAIQYRLVYAPASSNLGVTLLNKLTLKMNSGIETDTVTEKDFTAIDKLLTRPATLKHLSSTTKARIYNNIAMNAMYYAMSFESQHDVKKAAYYLDQADHYLNEALKFPDSPSVVAVSKAEISSYRIVLSERQNQDSSQAKKDAKKWMQEAMIKNYFFNKNVQQVVASSPVFSTLQKDFPTVSTEIWGGVNNQR